MKTILFVKAFAGLLIACLLVFQANGAPVEPTSFEIPDIESNLVVVAVGFRKTDSYVNGINVPIFTTDTNILGRMDTGVLFCVVSPKQFVNTFFILKRHNDEIGGLSVMVPSFQFFQVGRFYKIPYSIMDLGFGQGTNIYFTLGGGLRLNNGVSVHSNAFTTSKLETAGDYCRTLAKRYYFSADEARAEVELLRPQVVKYEKQLNEIQAAIKDELERREKAGIETPSFNMGDETDKYSILMREQYKILPLRSAAKSEMLNAEKQLKDYNNRPNEVKP